MNAELKPFLYAYVLFYGKIDPRKYQQTGFPMDTVQLYQGHAPKAGLLLRFNYYFLPQNNPQWALNTEPLPDGNVLLASIPYGKADTQFEILRIP